MSHQWFLSAGSRSRLWQPRSLAGTLAATLQARVDEILPGTGETPVTANSLELMASNMSVKKQTVPTGSCLDDQHYLFIFELFRAAGIRGIEAHMEAEHPGVAEEDWAYTVATQACHNNCDV